MHPESPGAFAGEECVFEVMDMLEYITPEM